MTPSTGDGVYRYLANGVLKLNADTNYWITLAGSTSMVRTTAWEGADAGAAAGWSIHPRSQFRQVGYAVAYSNSPNKSITMFQVRGAAASSARAGQGPAVTGAPGVSGAGDDARWSEGETVRVAVTFDRAVNVDTTSGRPSIGIALGASAEREASYESGTATTELVFAYTLVAADGAHAVVAVAPNTLSLNGATIRDTQSALDAALGHPGTIVQGRPVAAKGRARACTTCPGNTTDRGPSR